MPDIGLSVAHINLARGYRGGERQTQLLIEGLSAMGWRQKLVARRGELLAKSCVNIDELELVEVSGNAFSAALALRDVNLVNAHEGRSVHAAALNKWLRGIPYVITRRVQVGPRHSAMTRKMYGGAAGIIVLSSAIRQSMLALDAGLECIVIPDASGSLTSDDQTVISIRERFGNRFIAGHIGELDDSHKGQHQIIAMARRLRDELPELSFVLVGSGRDETALKQAAEDLPNVYFAGQVENVGDYLAAFDVFLYPSRHEGLGSVVLDAMVFELPVIATDVGGIPEIIEDGTNGYLCAVDDIDAMAQALRTLYRDYDLRHRISAKNLRKAKQFSPEQMTRSYADVYKRLIEKLDQERATL
jgi:glycosyltransferase involved in cell wall biosynthesis